MAQWHIGLEPETTTEYAGTSLGRYYTDPEVLLQTEIDGRREFFDRFGYGTRDIETVDVGMLFYVCATVLGAKLVYPEDDSPQIEGRLIDSLADIARLRIPHDIASAGLVPQVIEQYEHIRRTEEATGITPVFNLAAQSPLTTAIVLRGTELFSDIMTHPAEVKALLEIVTETALRILRFTEEFTGDKIDALGMDDDYGGLVSPSLYAEFSVPYMARMYEEFGRASRHLHTETLARGHLKHLRDLDLTELDAWPYHDLTVEGVREELPGVHFTWNCETVDGILFDTPEQIERNYREAVRAGAPAMHLVLCARGVPPGNIVAFMRVARELEHEGAHE